MKTTKNSSSITKANIIAIIGVGLLLIFTFLGHSYLSGGELGWDIVISVAITAVTVFLLWFLIRAKSAENEVKKWKIVEISTLVVYIIFALATSIFGGFMHFFVVNDNKDDIKEYARMDLQKIDNLYAEYIAFEDNALSVTGTGLRNATGPGQVCDEKLNKFMADNNIEHNRTSADNFEKIQRTKLTGSNYNVKYDAFMEKRNSIEAAVDSWSVMLVPSKANLIGKLAENAEKELTALSQNGGLPVISYDSSIRKYTITGYQTSEFKIEDGVESLQFKKALKDADGFSFVALLIVLLIHLLILFSYFVAYRTSTIEIGKYSEEDGGIIL